MQMDVRGYARTYSYENLQIEFSGSLFSSYMDGANWSCGGSFILIHVYENKKD